MICLQYKEHCEVLLDYTKRGGYDIKDCSKKAIRNLLHASIDVHSIRLISEFPGYVVKYISKIESHCAIMNFAERVYFEDFSRKLHLKERN